MKALLNPLVPKRPSVDVFSLFQLKWRCSSQQIFLMKPPNIYKKADLWDAKNWRPIWPKKKFFFDFFMLRRLESVFYGEKIFENFFEIFYQIGLQFSAPHWSAFNSTGFILAWFYRKMFRGHIGSLFEKIRRGEDLHLKRKRQKTSTRGRLGTARTLPLGEPMG